MTENMSTASVPASYITNANVVPNQIFVLDDVFNSLDTPLANGLAGSAINMQSVEFGNHRYEEVWMNLE